jgi:diguanylate cyclase (GGDEF)-like protein/PAS domain S-box-containing protein
MDGPFMKKGMIQKEKPHRRGTAFPSERGALPPPKKKIRPPSKTVRSARASRKVLLDLESDLFRTLMDNTTDRIYFKDMRSRFILINQAQANAFGLSNPSQAIGRTDFDYFTEEHARQAFIDEQKIIASGRSLVGLEEKETWPGGRETWASTTKIPMKNRRGRIIGTFGISRDITARKTLELSLHLTTNKLEETVNGLERKNREINILNEMGKMLEACRSQEETFPIISGQMGKLIPVREGKLFLMHPDGIQLEFCEGWGETRDRAESFPAAECLAIETGRIQAVTTPGSGGYCPHLRIDPGKEPVYLCIPLFTQEKAIGLLHLRDDRKSGEAVSLPDLKPQLAVTAAERIALALDNLTLRETLRLQSIRDELTGLFNRRYLDESLQREVARAKRRRSALGVMMIDVDHLKQINDTCGHDAGDALLKGVGRWLQSNTRAEDICCRYGGDEFVLILPDASLESTFARGQQIRMGIQQVKIEYPNRPSGYATVSIGVAGLPGHGQSRDELLAAADAALYQAKSDGRNKTVLAPKKTSEAP